MDNSKNPTPQLIADWCKILYTCYQDVADDYRRDSSVINCQVCEAAMIMLHNLARAVVEQMPDLWPELRLVSSRSIWHAAPGFDWAGAEVELRKIEAAAVAMKAGPAAAGVRNSDDTDDSAWVLLTKLSPPRIKNIGQRRRYIESHSDEIRSRRPLTKAGTPHPKRLEVHIGDWVKHWIEKDNQTFESLDLYNPRPITSDDLSDDLTDDFIAGAAKLYSDVRKGKKPKQ